MRVVEASNYLVVLLEVFELVAIRCSSLEVGLFCNVATSVRVSFDPDREQDPVAVCDGIAAIR